MLPAAKIVIAGRRTLPSWNDRLRAGARLGRLDRTEARDLLIVNREALTSYRRPLIATTLDDAVDRMASIALDIVGPDPCEVAVIHAYRIPFQGMHPLLHSRALLRGIEAQALEVLRGLVPPRCELVVRHGDRVAVVLDEIAARDADLVLIGARGRPSLSRMLRGKLATHVLDRGTCDLLIVGGRA